MADLLKGYAGPWAVAAGWAMDLHLGRQTREHEDIEIAVPRATFDPLRDLVAAQYEIFAAGLGGVAPLDPENQREKRQMWVWDRAVERWRMDIFLEPGDTTTWVSNRDPRVTMPYERLLRHSGDGIPYQAPETVLFMKAKHTRDKDQADFANALPTLDAPARQWLVEALELVHPGHAWIERCRAAS